MQRNQYFSMAVYVHLTLVWVFLPGLLLPVSISILGPTPLQSILHKAPREII